MIQKNKFGLIHTSILKVMKILIFRDFFEFSSSYFLFKKIKKWFLILRADMVERRHVATCVHATS